jgi:hypothetical protein
MTHVMSKTITPTADDRDAIVDYLREQLIGPLDGPKETLEEAPHKRYLSGILFPREADIEIGLADDIIDDSAGEHGGDESSEDPVALAAQQLPSSLGLSFVLPAWENVTVEISTARYRAVSKGSWRRDPLELLGEHAVVVEAPERAGRGRPVSLDEGSASIQSTWRPMGDGALVTLSLVNERRLPADGRLNAEDCLFQVSVRCEGRTGFLPYPTPMRIQAGDEEEELALQYRDVPTYAIGHGCATAWESREGHPSWIATTHLPDHTIPGVSFTLEGEDGDELEQVLTLEYLAAIDDDPSGVIEALDTFVDRYDDWAAEQDAEASVLPARHVGAATRLLERITAARLRMRRGVRRLESDPVARQAFAMANTAMLMQMIRTGPDHAGSIREWNDPMADEPSYADPDRRWRPFQLAFLLLTLESALDEEADDRDIVDLIWFPTGGGKTEAYLGLMAMVVLHRRLTKGDDGAGTAVITRYTLRLLTSQQFQRAATLICALEWLRRRQPERLGSVPISIGVWLGGNNSPNRYVDAVELVEKIRNREYTNISFQVEGCPWCGTRLVPSSGGPDAAWGVSATNDSFRMRCPRSTCEFHDALPVSSVDEDLYDRPPTCLIGTVDKFARLAWEPRAGVFLGAGDYPGPSLIIQDEFHLISGPLGTVVGLYEAAIDVVMAHHHARPKVVASTATIRRADEQSGGVFGRSARLFPPAGLSATNSYFVRRDLDNPGRRYVGVLPQGHTPLTGMVHLSAALLQSSEELQFDAPSDDAYWTLVAYHNSLRELGKSVTLAHDDIPARMGVIATAEDAVRSLNDDDIVELTGNVPAAEIPRNLELLTRSRGEPGAASFVASTNMLSVGVDVPRLGLMLVVGQPKTTSEYIQATSRVGRRTPGLVVTLYSSSKPRDRSHFESFVPYHSAVYRYVEPTSVTPFSVPARARALHAGLVILVRHGLGLAERGEAADFDRDDPELKVLVEEFLRRVQIADPSETDAVAKHLEELAGQWQAMVGQAAASGGLRYDGSGKAHMYLLRRFSQGGDSWPTLDSMRSIDTEARMKVRGEDG